MLEDKGELAEIAYRLIFGWPPKDRETAVRIAGNFENLNQLRNRMINHPDMHRVLEVLAVCEKIYHTEKEERRHHAAFKAFIATPAETEAKIGDIVGSFTDNYSRFHARRFADQLRTLLAIRKQMLAKRERIRVLDCGTMSVSRMYGAVVPEIDLCTADLAVKGQERTSYGAHEHYEINFERESLIEKYPGLAKDKFDVILFCEIMEHIRAKPSEMLEELKHVLASDGAIYLTTPNAMNIGAILSLFSGVSLQSQYSKRNRVYEIGNIHVREYTMKELVQGAEAAGLSVKYRAIEEYVNVDSMFVDRFVSARGLLTTVLTHRAPA